MELKILDDEGIFIVNQYLAKTSYYGSEFSYAYQCAWLSREPKCIHYAEENGVVYIAFQCLHLTHFKGELLFLPPLTTMDKVEHAYDAIADHFRLVGKHMRVIHAPREHVVLIDPDKYIVEESSYAAEYLYSSKDLVELSGKKYHAKRNHIAKFNKLYEYTYRKYERNDYESVQALFSAWDVGKIEREEEIEERESYALDRMLNNLDRLNLLASVIEIDGIIVAFTLGEILSNNIAIVHFEKADIKYEGIYAAINNMFAKEHFANTRAINRQEDIGLEGLRKAKMSYYPIGFQEKWLVQSIK